MQHILTDTIIERIIKDFQCARKHWNDSTEPWDAKVVNLLKDIYNIPSHVIIHNVQNISVRAQNKTRQTWFHNWNWMVSSRNLWIALVEPDWMQKAFLLMNTRILLNRFIHCTLNLMGESEFIWQQATRLKLGLTWRMHSAIFEAKGRSINILVKKMEVERLFHNLKREWRADFIGGLKRKLKDANYGLLTRRGPDIKFEFEKLKFLKDLEDRHSRQTAIERETTSQRDCENGKHTDTG